MTLRCAILLPACLFLTSGLTLSADQLPVDGQPPPAAASMPGPVDTSLDGFLREGRIEEGLQHYAQPASDSERFSLAVLQALEGLQQFSAGMNRFSYRTDVAGGFAELPFLRAAGMNRQGSAPGETATPERIFGIFNDLRTALRRANSTLASAGDEEFKVEVNLSQVRLDFDGDGTVSPHETLLTPLGGFLDLPAQSAAGEDIVVRFDSADTMWLKGYTHLLTGMLDVILSYGWRPAWDQSAHLIFVDYEPETPIASVSARDPGDMNFGEIADIIATLHAMRLEVTDENGLRGARDQFKAMIACSRISWQRILAETDDDLEWIPSPSQTGPNGARISQEEVDGWMLVLDELEAILAGEKLMPFWRLRPGLGINVDKLVNDPPTLDLIMLLQGSAFVPYLDEGEVSGQARWQDLVQPFGGNFGGFALWIN